MSDDPTEKGPHGYKGPMAKRDPAYLAGQKLLRQDGSYIQPDDPLHPLTVAELDLGLGPYTGKMMFWPDGDLTDGVRASDPTKVYGVGNGVVVERSPEWRRARLEWVRDHQPQCMACWGNRLLQVHHKHPFHLDPARELDPTNFITLCEDGRGINCHYLYGHGLDWKRFTPDPDAVAAFIRQNVFLHLQPPSRAALEEAIKTVLGGRLLRRVDG